MKKVNMTDTIMRLIRTSTLVICFLYLRSRYGIKIDAYIIVTITVFAWGLTEFLQSQRKEEPQEPETPKHDREDEHIGAAELAIALYEDYLNDDAQSRDNLLWDTLLKHRGHDVSIVSYGDFDSPADVCLECEDCGEVVIDAEIYTICERSDGDQV